MVGITLAGIQKSNLLGFLFLEYDVIIFNVLDVSFKKQHRATLLMNGFCQNSAKMCPIDIS